MNALSTEVNFGQEVTDKVRQLIMNAMPEEKLQAVLKGEFDLYFNCTTDRWGNNGKSRFSVLVQAEVEKFMNAKVHELVHQYLGKLVFGNGEAEAMAVLEAITPAVQKAMMRDMASNVAQAYVLGLQNQPRQY